MSNVEIRPVSGIAVDPWLDELADLRIKVFRDYPYLYQGDRHYERDYLENYARSGRSLFVLALEYNRVIGAATALPLEDAAEEFQQPFIDQKRPLAPVFYFGESVLLPDYRGQGIGHRFFDLREQYAADFGFTQTAFCAVVRDPDDPRRPPDYWPLDSFWRGHGYQPVPGMQARFRWLAVGDNAPSENLMQFWLREAGGQG